MRGGIWAILFVCADACAAEAASKAKPQISAETLKHAIESKTGSVQLITFPDTGWSAVKIVRGGEKSRLRPAAEKAEGLHLSERRAIRTQVGLLPRWGIAW